MMALNRLMVRKILFLSVLLVHLPFSVIKPHDYHVTGSVTDPTGSIVPGARVSIVAGTKEYVSITGTDGKYSIRLSGIYGNISGLIESGIPFPNPFSVSVNIPFIINSQGDIKFSVYNFSGQKVVEIHFNSVNAGSYRLVWDGCNQNGSPQKDGFYFYVINFKGESVSGKIVKAHGYSQFSAGTALEPVMMPSEIPVPSGKVRIPVVTSVTCQQYYSVRLTDITISRDTIIDFELTPSRQIPFKTSGDHIAMYSGSGYRKLVLKGINLGSSPPGFFPGEIAYAISPHYYETWIKGIAEAGFNSIRIYTLHPPVFYEKLAEYNYRHPQSPLLLFQGIWLEEVENRYSHESYDLINRTAAFKKEIHQVVDCINGSGNLAFRYGKAYGRYLTDVSRWTAGYIIGREISPQEVDSTNTFHPSISSFSGTYLSVTGASATEAFVTMMLDETLAYEQEKYSTLRPVSVSSWPTLDPLKHPSEVFTDEDVATFDITKIKMRISEPGIFASYHAYPYYPNFISQQQSYQIFSDDQGPNSYLGYLNDLKSYYSMMPLVIAEFGVPSSWGSAHQSYSNMHHGGFSERQQGENNIRIMHNIINSGCAGGFMFAWMDEWFKPTWIVLYLEAYGIISGDVTIPTRQLWHNMTSPEQNFGLITFEQQNLLPFISYTTDNTSGPLRRISATNDNQYFHLEMEANRNLSAGDTFYIVFDTYLKGLGESVLPNGKHLENRSEFLLLMVIPEDTALFMVTKSYDMNGLTSRFDLSNHTIQKFRSTITDGGGWNLMQWINDQYMLTRQDIGKLPMENNAEFTSGERAAAAWQNNKIRVRIPWTMLYFHDPTQMQVIDGAISYDGGYNYEISTALSDGIAISVYFDKKVISSTSRYTWPNWLVVPSTVAREKKALDIIRIGLASIPGFKD